MATTTTINITGGSGLTANTDQTAIIDMAVRSEPRWRASGAAGHGGLGQHQLDVNLGNEFLGDAFTVDDANTAAVAPLDLNAGANGVDLDNNGDLDVVVANTEINTFQMTGVSLADNTIDLSGSTATGGPFAADAFITDAGAAGTVQTLSGGSADDEIIAGAGNDWIAPGLGNDNVMCGV